MYRKTQPGTLIRIVVGGALAITAGVALASGWHPVVFVPLALLAACLVLFGSLTVEVGREAVRVAFGPGVIHRTIPLERIAGARPVPTRWFYGWGIRLTPRGWMWNVSGLQAVELEYVDGGTLSHAFFGRRVVD